MALVYQSECQVNAYVRVDSNNMSSDWGLGIWVRVACYNYFVTMALSD